MTCLRCGLELVQSRLVTTVFLYHVPKTRGDVAIAVACFNETHPIGAAVTTARMSKWEVLFNVTLRKWAREW